MSRILEGIEGTHTRLELPSLRVDALDSEIYDLIRNEKPSSFTFAPEAGSQRLRDVINKNVTEADIFDSIGRAFDAGAKKIKLYFMIGLPTETDADLDALVDLVRRIVKIAPGGGAQITVSISPFAPKAHTPFQWAGQISRKEIDRRNVHLQKALRPTRVKLSLRDPEVSRLEALLGLGDRRLAETVLAAWRAGARFDAWDEHFDPSIWEAAISGTGIDPRAYLDPRDPDAPLPWDGVFAQVDRGFLKTEWEKALDAQVTGDCRLTGGCDLCEACGPELTHIAADIPARESKRPVSGPEAPAFDPRNARPDDPALERDRWRKWRERAPGKCWYRMEFTKTGTTRFLGHLDFQRLLQMALRRSGLSVAYSQGFNPRPLFKFGPPLPLGVGGEHELMDLAFTHMNHGWEARLDAELPDSVRILGSEVIGPAVPESIDKSVDRQDYRVILPATEEGGPDRQTVQEAIDAFLELPERIHLRRRPKGDVEVDVRPMVEAGGLRICAEPAILPGGTSALEMELELLREHDTPGLPIHDFLAALFGAALPEPRLCVITRTALLSRDKDGGWRSPLERVREINRRYWLRKHISA